MTASELDITRAGTGPRVVFVHGGAGPADTWAGQWDLRERWELVVPCMRGYGASPVSRRRDFAVDADDIVPLLGPAAHLVGFSYGAIATLVVAGAWPGRVCSLTVIEPPLLGIAPDVASVRELRQTLEDPFGDRERARERLQDAFAAFGAGPDNLERNRGEDGDISVRMLRVMRLLRGARPPAEARPDLGAIARAHFPVLVLSGGHHAALEAIAVRLAAETGAVLDTLPGRGHLVPQASGFNDRLERFLISAERARTDTDGMLGRSHGQRRHVLDSNGARPDIAC